MKLTRTEVQRDVDRLERRVTAGPGVVPRERRQAVAAGEAAGGPLGAYLEKVRHHAYDITDAEVAALRASGTSDDEIFELTVAAALGASKRRLEAGLAAIAAAYGED